MTMSNVYTFIFTRQSNKRHFSFLVFFIYYYYKNDIKINAVSIWFKSSEYSMVSHTILKTRKIFFVDFRVK